MGVLPVNKKKEKYFKALNRITNAYDYCIYQQFEIFL